MRRQQRQSDEPQGSSFHPKSPAFDARELSARNSAQYQSIRGSTKHQALDLSGRQPVVPQRPPNMPRLDTPPAMPRVPRPQHTPMQKPIRRKVLFVLGGVVLLVALMASGAGIFLFSALNASSGPSQVAVDFFSSLTSQNYDQSYKDLGPAITSTSLESPQQFTGQAQSLDTCYGPLSSYHEVPNSAKIQNNIYSYTYTVKRTHLSKSYTIQIQLQQDNNNNWRITSYGESLGPPRPAPACSK